MPPIPFFGFGSITQNKHVESTENFSFSLSSKDFYEI